MEFYSELADTAREMLEEFGQPVVITRYETAVEDISTGMVTMPSSTYTSEVGVLLDFDYRAFGSGLEGRFTIGRVDKRLIMSAGVAVQPNDSISVDGALYKIINIKLVRPSQVSVVYDLWIQQ